MSCPSTPSTSPAATCFRLLAVTLLGAASALAASSQTGTPRDAELQTASAQQPVITGISPNNLQSQGGIAITITGQGFTSATSAMVGGAEVIQFQVIDDESIVALTSADMDGYSTDVMVRTARGTCIVPDLLDMDPVQQGMAVPPPPPPPPVTTTGNPIQSGNQGGASIISNTLITGPFAGVDYLYGSVTGYAEAGGGLGALSYGRQTFESLVSRVGWSVAKRIRTS